MTRRFTIPDEMRDICDWHRDGELVLLTPEAVQWCHENLRDPWETTWARHYIDIEARPRRYGAHSPQLLTFKPVITLGSDRDAVMFRLTWDGAETFGAD